jgi:hypothetical protein
MSGDEAPTMNDRKMNKTNFRRLSAHIAISVALAAITPAAAAGLVEGVQVAANTVDDATSVQTIAPDANGAEPNLDANTDRAATGAPRRLSPLAGTDATAWASAKEIRAQHTHKVPVQ